MQLEGLSKKTTSEQNFILTLYNLALQIKTKK